MIHIEHMNRIYSGIKYLDYKICTIYLQISTNSNLFISYVIIDLSLILCMRISYTFYL